MRLGRGGRGRMLRLVRRRRSWQVVRGGGQGRRRTWFLRM
jgi:hypothetical protein